MLLPVKRIFLVYVFFPGSTKNTNFTSLESASTSVLPVTSANAYLKTGSVQEWFIDLHDSNNNKMTLTMTIRSDSEYREKKQKGKLGAFMMLKLLYRG